MGGYISVVFNLPVDTAFTYRLPDEKKTAVGSRVIAPFGKRSLAGFVVEAEASAPEGLHEIKEITRVIDEEPLFDGDFLDLGRWISEMYYCSLGESLAAMVPGGRRETDIPGVGIDEAAYEGGEIIHTPEQNAAIARITEAGRGIFYLYGVTGSGKTEVFLQTAKKTIDSGRGVIYLVPEISLTRQVVETITSRLGREAAVLHSRLTPSQRLREWRRIQHGEVSLVIGARSAVFAPLESVGLIIIDEEHEGSYKSAASPRYHARQVAMKRCARADALLVMGSATPSLEAWYQMQRGTIGCITLPQRVSGGGMPELQILDLSGAADSLSAPLVEEIRRTHREGRQTILFLNRRGFSYFFHCRSCGYEMKCRHCSVGLTFHKTRELMVCHYCGYKSRPIDVCPDCGSLDVGYSGFGTEKIEEDVRRIFPELSLARVDTDAVRKKGSLEQVLDDFRAGKIDLLLGTQMVAKGLNFPGVKLVGIVLADTGLHLPDFRAAERTFALITQVAGRAGRFLPDGKVMIQTFRPGNEAIRLAREGRLEDFYAGELEVRKSLGFPPYGRMIRFVFRGKDRKAVTAVSRAFFAACREAAEDHFMLLGPSECPLSVLSGNYRRHLIVLTGTFGKTHRIIAQILERFKAPSRVYLEVDVDPVSLL